MRRLSRELISALRLSFEAWPDVAASGFEEGHVKAECMLATVWLWSSFLSEVHKSGCGKVIMNLG
jgi:hypothetical protein